jgi:hypothetical protein
MTTLWQDVRYAVRMLRKTPGFTAIALVTLATGIGANTIMFSISDLLLLLHPRKVKNPEQLAYCAIPDADRSWFRYSEYLTLRDSRLAFRDLMAESVVGDGPYATLAHGDSAWQVQTTYVRRTTFPFWGLRRSRDGVSCPRKSGRAAPRSWFWAITSGSGWVAIRSSSVSL